MYGSVVVILKIPLKINKIKGIRGPKWGFLTLIKEVFENGQTLFFVKYGTGIYARAQDLISPLDDTYTDSLTQSASLRTA